MVGWHQRLNGHGFGRTLGVGDGQGGLACCSSWGHKESDTLECMVKWALGSITTDKASGSYGIPAELFQILRYCC